MTRSCLAIVCLATWLLPVELQAQYHHHHHVHVVAQPFVVYPGYGFTPYWPQPVQVAYYSPSVSFAVPSVVAPGKSFATPSKPAARLKSLELQAKGDQRLRQQKWAEARAAYADAVTAAPDRAEAHFRLGLCYVAIQQFDSAIAKFKLALRLDPTIPKTGKKLEELLGPASQIVRNSIISKLSDWVGEDIHSSDRLFLLGVVLHFNGDPRAREAFQVAMQMSHSADVGHIALFLNPQTDQPIPNPDGIPQLKPQPFAPLNPQPDIDFRFPKSPMPIPAGPVPIPGGPVPMPDGPVPTT